MKRKDCPYYFENIPKDKLFIACIPLSKGVCKTCTRHDGWVDEPTNQSRLLDGEKSITSVAEVYDKVFKDDCPIKGLKRE
jgi:hypothetical protein